MPERPSTELQKMLDSIYENYTSEKIECTRTDFVNLLMDIAKDITNGDEIPRECFSLIDDLRIIFSELVTNSLCHGKDPHCRIWVAKGKQIVVRVHNIRIKDEDKVFTDRGRGMTFIKENIMSNEKIEIIHTHTEKARSYIAYLVISLDDFTDYIRQHCTSKA